MNITTNFLTINKYSRPGTKRSKTTKIAWHYVANPGSSASANRNYFQNSKVYASSHYILGLKGEILYIVPDDEIAYTTNSANSYSIGIECCHPTSDGHYNDATYNSMVELGAYLCEKYNLDPTDDMIRHYDITRKICPKWFVDNPNAWIKFKNDVKNKMNRSTSDDDNGNIIHISPNTKSDWVKELQTYLNNAYSAKLNVDGYVGPKTYAAVKNRVVGKGYITKGTLVSLLQEALGDLDIDGSCGPKTIARIKEYQKNNGLAIDGLFGPDSWKKLFNM
ncbi:peptidoglycan recognition protein family protein [Romboutsia sp. Marseille-P6047]|uniref:peptidoglycan recognition protein family protein n=1 Tax=Romboutsia sp. Marseille-P6047 TaxID=2161817 RepID=UPI000F067A96|nr:N-acetylmuramoyl-L-alanine amidase [Romboutsia sp. Marseille-P6047]